MSNGNERQVQQSGLQQEGGLMSQGLGGPTTPAQNLRGEAGEGFIQADRFAAQVGRLKGIICSMGLLEQTPEKSGGSDEAVNPNDLNWTIKTTASTLRACCNQLEELISLLESQMI